MKSYPAPWGKPLIITSTLATLLCLGIGLMRLLPVLRGLQLPAGWLFWLPLVLVPGCALFTVRGYGITPDAILIRRLFWTTRLSRAGFQSAEIRPKAMSGSIRTCGNGGFFSFTGWYWNRSLRSYRAFVTDLNRTVVLRFRNRTVVLSPENPEDFVRELGAPFGGNPDGQ